MKLLNQGAPPSEQKESLGFWWRLVVVTGVWLVATRCLGTYGVYAIPACVVRHLTLQTYLMIVQVVTTALGLGLAVALLRNARIDLALLGLRPRHLGLIVLATPIVFVAISYVAVGAAYQTLLDEVARGGAEVSRRNAGEFGRALKQEPALLILIWGAVFAPIAEELLFRGALWTTVNRLVGRWHRPARAADDTLAEFIHEGVVGRAARAVYPWMLTGGVATIAAAGLFGWMHADLKGGVGIVRVVSSTCLGLVCGTIRHLTGTVVAAIVLHLGFNALSIGLTRRWFVLPGWPSYYFVPTLLSAASGFCLVGLVVVAVVRGLRRGAASPEK